MNFQPSHFTAVLVFACFTSIVLGITQRSDRRAMVKYGASAFGLFVGSAIVLSWVMFLLAR